MSKHIIEISRYGKHWCRLETPETNEQPVIEDVYFRYPAEDGFEVKLYLAKETRRFLESSPDGLKIIAVDYALNPVGELASNHSRTA